MLERLPDLAELEWIQEAIGGRKPLSREPRRVSHQVPSLFPAYAKIRHAVHVDLSIDDPHLTYADDDADGPLTELAIEAPELAAILKERMDNSEVELVLGYDPLPVPEGHPAYGGNR